MHCWVLACNVPRMMSIKSNDNVIILMTKTVLNQIHNNNNNNDINYNDNINNNETITLSSS